MSDEHLLTSDDVALTAAGFSHREAQFVTALQLHAELAAAIDDPPDDLETWLEQHLPPAWVCRLMANHVTSANEGARIYEAAFDRPGLTAQLDRRADMLGANCRDLIIDESALTSRIAVMSRTRATSPDH